MSGDVRSSSQLCGTSYCKSGFCGAVSAHEVCLPLLLLLLLLMMMIMMTMQLLQLPLRM